MKKRALSIILICTLLLSFSVANADTFDELNQRKKAERIERRKNISFSDIEKHWGKDDILFITKLGVVDGSTDKKFNPNDNVTRAEAAKMIALTYGHRRGIGYSSEEKFNDIDNKWYRSYVSLMIRADAIPPHIVGKFDGNKNITRAEVAYMIDNMISSYDFPKVNSNGEFNDLKNDYWGYSEIQDLYNKNLMQGYNGNFRPDENITRGELATILANSLKINDSIDYH